MEAHGSMGMERGAATGAGTLASLESLDRPSWSQKRTLLFATRVGLLGRIPTSVAEVWLNWLLQHFSGRQQGVGHKKSLATTYSPTVKRQYHRRGRA
jgi:hypothetical protein